MWFGTRRNNKKKKKRLERKRESALTLKNKNMNIAYFLFLPIAFFFLWCYRLKERSSDWSSVRVWSFFSLLVIANLNAI